ncbi:MAG: prepilin-type N-terminal cleavage/methylation domain-containing protein [Candidatus Omnitrophota bacterium]
MHKKAGFTLAEVIIATIILIISLLGGIAFFSLNRNNLSYANRQRLATWGAVYKIEQLKSMNYSDMELLLSPAIENNLNISGKIFTRKTTITDIGAGPDYKQVTVEMGWNPGSFPVSLTTYISPK